MKRAIVLDSGPLSLVCNKLSPNIDAIECQHWYEQVVLDGWTVVIPEIADYETRRELIRAKKSNSLKELDRLNGIEDYIPITTDIMIHAAALWAQARNEGQAASDPKAIDGDVILSAHALSINQLFDSVIVATTNTTHLIRYCPANLWRNITR